jgi:hypothetical protein
MPYVIPDFRVGRQTVAGQSAPTEPFPVTVIHKHEARRFFNCQSDTELRNHLRGLRDLGVLVHKPGRLTQTVRIGPRERIGAYVCRGDEADIPKRRARVGGRVVGWR